MSTERRRAPRIELVDPLKGQSTSTQTDVVVSDISLTGLRIESAAPFTVNDVHDFQLTLGDGALVALRGRVVYSRPLTTETESRYVTGVEFLADATDAAEDVIDRLT